MPLSKALTAKLNEQVTNEFFASQLYLSMSFWLEAQGLQMMKVLYRKQAEEERGHALKIADYIASVEGTVSLQAIAQPTAEFRSPLAAIEAALEHERKVTGQINALVALADQEKDYATRSFLNWFVDEQVEEVDTQLKLAQIAKIVGERYVQLEAYVAQALLK
jgi:ferritin